MTCDPDLGQPWFIVSDIDGTLIGYDHTPSPEAVEAVAEVVEAGHLFVLASGRSLIAMQPIAETLGLREGWMICSNGSVIVRLDPELPTGFEIVEAITFDPEHALRELSAHLPGALFAVEDVGVGFRLSDLFPEGELGGAEQVVSLEELWQDEVVRVVVRGADATSESFREKVRDLGLDDVTYSVGWTAWMDISPKGVTKASAAEKVRARHGIPPERTLAIGDGSNDIEMLQWAGRGVAMGNADDVVKQAADEVAPPVDQGGVAVTLRSLLQDSQ